MRRSFQTVCSISDRFIEGKTHLWTNRLDFVWRLDPDFGKPYPRLVQLYNIRIRISGRISTKWRMYAPNTESRMNSKCFMLTIGTPDIKFFMKLFFLYIAWVTMPCFLVFDWFPPPVSMCPYLLSLYAWGRTDNSTTQGILLRTVTIIRVELIKKINRRLCLWRITGQRDSWQKPSHKSPCR